MAGTRFPILTSHEARAPAPQIENSKKLAHYTWMLISLLILPQIIPKQYLLLAESNEFLFYYLTKLLQLN